MLLRHNDVRAAVVVLVDDGDNIHLFALIVPDGEPDQKRSGCR